jgi:hypothetical protein
VVDASGNRSSCTFTVTVEHGGGEPTFLRGDCDADGAVAGSVNDAVFLFLYNFLGGPEPPCIAACDANADGAVLGQVTDGVYILQYNFLGGPPPPAPFPDCGPSKLPSDAGLGCRDSDGCAR